MVLPNNGDRVVDSCPNCDNQFEESQPLGENTLCDPETGGCGFRFKLSAVKNKLEKEAE